jgi:cell division protein ZapA (FtsZ GTPase activity inhibitor)
MTDEKHSVRVTIFGHEYAIRGEADEGYIRDLARYVNGKMDEVARTTGVGVPLRVAILSAINLADEVFRLRAAKGDRALQDKGSSVVASEAIAALAQHIEDALKED